MARRKQFSCIRCGKVKGFLLDVLTKGISPKDRPCKTCRNAVVSQKNKGKPAWNKGIPPSDETKEKLRQFNLGKPAPNKGVPTSQETKIRLSCFNRGISVEEFDDFTTAKNDADRVKIKKSTIRQECFELASFSCRCCGVRGGILNAHHLDNFAQFPDLRFEISNLVCLCKGCHNKFHEKFGTRNNVRRQFEEFLNAFTKQVVISSYE